jgi:putative ABC transport system substrate-binding protein
MPTLGIVKGVIVNRRKLIGLLGFAAGAWPLALRAQQAPMPTIGLLGTGSAVAVYTTAFAQGLREAGYQDGRNVRFVSRWSHDGSIERLPALAAELVDLKVSLIAAFGTLSARAAKEASGRVNPTLPVVFATGSDPVAEGFVVSLSRPGRNMTGASSVAGSLASKRLELLRQLLPNSAVVALLINPDNPLGAFERSEAEAASKATGMPLEIITARSAPEIDAAFAALRQRNIGSIVISVDTFYFGQNDQIAALAARHRLPAIGPLREFATAGGLMSYGTSIAEVNRSAGVTAGRVLKGEKPTELPVLQPTKFEFVINLKTAKALGLTISDRLLALADEVIE